MYANIALSDVESAEDYDPSLIEDGELPETAPDGRDYFTAAWDGGISDLRPAINGPSYETERAAPVVLVYLSVYSGNPVVFEGEIERINAPERGSSATLTVRNEENERRSVNMFSEVSNDDGRSLGDLLEVKLVRTEETVEKLEAAVERQNDEDDDGASDGEVREAVEESEESDDEPRADGGDEPIISVDADRLDDLTAPFKAAGVKATDHWVVTVAGERLEGTRFRIATDGSAGIEVSDGERRSFSEGEIERIEWYGGTDEPVVMCDGGEEEPRRWRDWSNVEREKENEERIMTDGGYTFGGPRPANPERCPDCERLVSRTVNGNRCPYCREETFEDDGSVLTDGGAEVHPDDEGVEIVTDGGQDMPRCPNDEELLEPTERGGDAMLECPECGYQCGDPLTPARRRYRELQTEYHTLIDRHQELKSEGMTERADELLGAINAIEELLNYWDSANIKERK